ncbi:hypothetical protein AQF98_13955 [Pedobacter sp. Hv1]|nr:hypothetical protein AQF98_13955 [Pedobacter sp. Hv1]
MLAILTMSIQSTEIEAMVSAIKAIFMPVLLFFTSLLLLAMSLYFFFKGRRKGRPKKHIRFL